MRNLKRVLSLALAAIMLMGMMIMGTSAANASSFVDADEISHEEAATLLAGLEVFTGNELGEFDPEGRVTRAMMATIICKILHGADVNVKIYEGTGKFSDTVGNYAWSEGWVTMCSTLGIVNGYGDGRFGVDDTILTWQAAYMLERALGYWLPGDPSQGDQLSVMKTGSEIGLFGDLNLRANDQLTRDQVAEMTFNALFAQQVRWSDDRGNYVKANNSSVSVVAGTKDPSNTLARNVYQLYQAEGIVVANGMTDAKLYSDDDATPGDTRVVFDGAWDVLDTGRNTHTSYDFAYDTGLDMIGHNAGVYYQLVRGVPVVKAIVDRATLVETIPYDANSTRLAKAANDLGFKRNTILNFKEDDYLVNYDMNTKANTVNNVEGNDLEDDLFNDSIGKDLIVISNSVDYSVDYVFVLDQKVNQVKSINRQGVITLVDATGITSKGVVAPYGAAEGDYVIATDIGNQGDRVVLEKAEIITARVTEMEGRVGAYTMIIAGGVPYVESPVFANTGSTKMDKVTAYQSFNKFASLNLMLDKNGKLIGYVTGEKDPPKYCYVAYYGKVHINPLTSSGASNFTTEGLAAYVYLMDGTKGIYQVNTSSNGVLANTKAWNESATSTDLDDAIEVLNEGVYYGNTYAADANHGTGTHDDCTGGLGIWEYTISNGVIKLTSLIKSNTVETAHVQRADGTTDAVNTAAATAGTYVNTTYDAGAADGNTVRFVKGHSGVLNKFEAKADGKVTQKNVTDESSTPTDKTVWQTANTVYFFVNGTELTTAEIDADASAANLKKDISDKGLDKVTTARSFSVGYKTGVTAIDTFDIDLVAGSTHLGAFNYLDSTKTFVAQAFVDQGTTANGTNSMTAVLVRNAGVSETGDIYYYTKGTDTLPSFRIREVEEDKEYVISYRLFDLQGEESWKDFTFTGSWKEANNKAKSKMTGYYELLSSDIREYVALRANSASDKNTWNDDNFLSDNYTTKEVGAKDQMFVVNATLSFKEGGKVQNLIDNVTTVGSIFNLNRNTNIVDTCGSGLETLDDIINAFEENDNDCRVTISYMYDTDKWTCDTVFITEYAPTKTDAPGVKGEGSITGEKLNQFALGNGVKKADLKDYKDGAYNFTNSGLAKDIIANLTDSWHADAKAGTQLKDVLFLHFTPKYGTTTATLYIRNANGQLMYKETLGSGLNAGEGYMCYTQVTTGGGSTGFWTVTTAEGASGPMASDGAAGSGVEGTPLAKGDYTWEIVMTASGEETINLEGSFTVE